MFAIELETLAMRAFTDLNALPDRWSAPSVDIWIVWGRALLSGIVWTDAVCGRVMPMTQTVGELAPARNDLGRSTGFMIYKWKAGGFFGRSGYVGIVNATVIADAGSVASEGDTHPFGL